MPLVSHGPNMSLQGSPGISGFRHGGASSYQWLVIEPEILWLTILGKRCKRSWCFTISEANLLVAKHSDWFPCIQGRSHQGSQGTVVGRRWQAAFQHVGRRPATARRISSHLDWCENWIRSTWVEYSRMFPSSLLIVLIHDSHRITASSMSNTRVSSYKMCGPAMAPPQSAAFPLGSFCLQDKLASSSGYTPWTMRDPADSNGYH